jgi:hypothetical protein
MKFYNKLKEMKKEIKIRNMKNVNLYFNNLNNFINNNLVKHWTAYSIKKIIF